MQLPNVDLLFEDKSGIKAVSKPAGMDTLGFDDSGIPRLHILMNNVLPEASETTRLHFKRIDRYTSGMQLVGCGAPASGFLSRMWKDYVHKNYLAIIENPRWEQVDVSLKIDGKPSRTGLTVLQRNPTYSLVQCELLEHGRTHQIRRALKALGNSIVGDFTYRGWHLPLDKRQGQMLHAWKVNFPLPNEKFEKTNFQQYLQAPVPQDFRELFDFDWDLVDEGAAPVLKSWPVDESAYTWSGSEVVDNAVNQVAAV